MNVRFAGIYRIHGSAAMRWASGYAQAIHSNHWQVNRLATPPVVYPWSHDDGLTWQAVLLTGKESHDFLELESASKAFAAPSQENSRFLNQVQTGYAQSSQALDLYV